MAKKATIAHKEKKSVFEEIYQWGSALSPWKQDALRRLLQKSGASQQDHTEIMMLCKQTHGADLFGSVPPTPVPLSEATNCVAVDTEKSVQLLGIEKPQNINALCSEQELTFSADGLTIVFGYNASGKSGYGRILRNVCRGRKKAPTLKPNVLAKTSGGQQSVTFKYRSNGNDGTESWQVGKQSPAVLSSISIFDSECASVHVTQKNTLAFTPSGLEVLPAFATLMKEIQGQLKTEKATLESQKPQFLQGASFSPKTSVGIYLSRLTGESDTTELDELANLSEEEIHEMQRLQVELAYDPAKLAAESRRIAGQLRELKAALSEAGQLLDDDSMVELESLTTDAEAKRQAAEAAAMMLSTNQVLDGVGSDVWKHLWTAAREFAALAYSKEDFPPIHNDAVCLLCQQPLDEAARMRLSTFEAFVNDASQRQSTAAARVLSEKLDRIGYAALWTKKCQSLRRWLKINATEIHNEISSIWLPLLLRYRKVVSTGPSAVRQTPLPSLDRGLLLIDGFVESLQAKSSAMSEDSHNPERIKIQARLFELKDRHFLHQVLGDIKEHIDRLDSIARLEACIADTNPRAITAKSAELTEKFAEGKLRNAFATEIQMIGSRLRRFNVELAEAGSQRGEKYYEVRLVAASKESLEGVVSEGEHRCIALAGFLAELATEEGKSAIIFDDPVTSLDHLWRGAFADRIVREAAGRQVIVFTHDVVFLHDLLSRAVFHEVPVTHRGLRATSERTGIVSDELPWTVQGCLDRLDKLTKRIKAELQPLHDAGEDDSYWEAVRQFYDNLRGILEQSIEEIVVCRCVHRYRNEVKTQDLKLITLFTEQDSDDLQKLHKTCCDHVTAHDRALYRGISVPAPQELRKDADELARIMGELSQRQTAERKVRKKAAKT